MSYLSEQFTGYDRYLALEAFSQGRNFSAWKFFGAHPDMKDGETGYRFIVWAPNAKLVSLTGDFNQWNVHTHPLSSMEGGIWETFVPRLNQYDAYKFAVHGHDGRIISKSDPYAFHAETRPGTASKLYPMGDYQWNDQGWKKYLQNYDPYNTPMNVYELHLGSWRRGGQGEYLDYRSIAALLVPYVKEMGYTHVELMPVMEHPLDDSWGYQVTGYFSATSRFGTPDDLKYLIDQLHQGGVGVILDWVPAHFPRDEFGLYEFDGTPTYEYQDKCKGEHPQWGTNCFDLGRNEVKSFLFSSAMFWIEEYHADGLRVDAVSSMLYLNFGRENEEWMPNIHGGQENLEAIDFLRQLNTEIFNRYPKTLMVAEEATSWPQVTHPVSEGGLGFNFKWNMGWMNDICHYIELEPLARQHHHKDLTFAMMYAFNENYILPMSHDEVVHEKSSFVGKMAGDTFNKLASARAFQLYIMTHPGKKLTFMGAEIGQWDEWNFKHSMDWHLMEFDDHKRMNFFHKKANELYLKSPALWQKDNSWDGFLWLCADDNLGNTLAYARWDNEGNPLVVVCNFSPVHRQGYRVALPLSGVWEEVLNSDWAEFGGGNQRNEGSLPSEDVPCYGQNQSMEINLPGNGTVVFRCVKKSEESLVELFDEEKQDTFDTSKENQDYSSDESERWEAALRYDAEHPEEKSMNIPTIPLAQEEETSQGSVTGKKAGSTLTIGEETLAPVDNVVAFDSLSGSVEVPVETPQKRTRKKKEEKATETMTAKQNDELEEPFPQEGTQLGMFSPVEEVAVEPEVPEPKKRTRKKKEDAESEVGTAPVATPKKRGRPKKVVDISTASGAVTSGEPEEKPKKRGRPKKSKGKTTETED